MRSKKSRFNICNKYWKGRKSAKLEGAILKNKFHDQIYIHKINKYILDEKCKTYFYFREKT